MEQCSKCKGAGMVRSASDDQETGARLRKLREAKGISLRAVARHMDKTPGYLSDLEHGRRAWSAYLEEEYKSAIGEE